MLFEMVNQTDRCGSLGVLSFDGISIAYRGRPALGDVTLSACRGCVTAVVGPSGSGKSSLLWLAAGLLGSVPGSSWAGKVALDGTDLLAMDRFELSRRVGMVFQRPAPFPLSIHENVALALREHGLCKGTVLEGRVESALRQVGLWDEVKDRTKHSALTLSGGQQQRLCMARALALRPGVLLLDEPCSALDPLSTARIEDLIREIQAEVTILLVTHNLGQARRLAKTTAVFNAGAEGGRLVKMGPTHELFATVDESFASRYLAGMLG